MKKLISIILAAAMVVSMVLCFGSCGTKGNSGTTASSAAAAIDASKFASAVTNGVLTIGSECGYAPYNWQQKDDSNGAVQINGDVAYANGYDIMMAKKICEKYGWKLKVVRMDFDSLVPAVQSGQIDCAISGQSMTAERMKAVDFAGPYIYASIVCLTKKTSKFANAKGISELAGGSCTSQISTIWYDKMLKQIKNANIKTAKESAPAMLMALETGDVDFVCTDIPTAQAAVIAYPDMKILDFTGSSDNFTVSDEDVNIGISVKKGNAALKDAINAVLKDYNKDSFNAMMNEAIKIQPLTKSETTTAAATTKAK